MTVQVAIENAVEAEADLLNDTFLVSPPPTLAPPLTSTSSWFPLNLCVYGLPALIRLPVMWLLPPFMSIPFTWVLPHDQHRPQFPVSSLQG